MARQSFPPAPRRARWAAWLVLGVLAGLLLGFAAGLAKPRPRADR
ncbi:uncharacterized protein involved in exopolysaccharide biosynthesis [Friedmanniella endophytica]|uniref:Uncharacterized protein involved in exopolysaccharide biosynthesis n=1 Tax=Microlunatus kandeliicorticis TaxID=1759536 RepID=A0A7W3P560_9ACTN|nr:hypothetical protein [Microlunatus kandeliicorticis]MBA8793618.1 uncharacterized protein involved in exopolysaccharide biosynthesis [Microlunatus kandeliicorticis]